MEMTKERAKDLIGRFIEKYELVRVGNGQKIHIVPAGTSATLCGSGHSNSGGIRKMRIVKIDEVKPTSDFCAHCNSQFPIGRALYVLAQPDEPETPTAPEPVAPIASEPIAPTAEEIAQMPTLEISGTPTTDVTTLDQAFQIVITHLTKTPENAEMRSSAKFCLAEAHSARGRKDYTATIAWLHRADSYLVGSFEARRIALMDEEKIAEEENSGMAKLRTELAKVKKDAEDAWLFYQTANDLLEEAKKDLAAMTELREDAESRASDNQRLFDDARHGWEEEKRLVIEKQITIGMVADERDLAIRECDEARAQIVTMNAAMEDMRQAMESMKKDLESERARNDQAETELRKELNDAIEAINELQDSI